MKEGKTGKKERRWLSGKSKILCWEREFKRKRFAKGTYAGPKKKGKTTGDTY